MTGRPKPPDDHEPNLAEATRRRFAAVGGVDDLEPHLPVTVGEPSWHAFDQTLVEARSKFADMSPEELEALIAEAVAAARAAKSKAPATDRAQAQEPCHMRHEDFRLAAYSGAATGSVAKFSVGLRAICERMR